MSELNLTPEMLVDLLAMAKEVKTIGKGGWNEKSEYTYAVADAVIKEARELLGRHNLIWMKTAQRIAEPKLHSGDIGRQYYVGEVEISGLIIHSSGGMIPITSEIPIVAKGASPHDKSAAASSTFGTGYMLLGVLNADREGAHSSIDTRTEDEQPTCTGDAQPIANANKARCEALAEADAADREAVWGWACKACGVPSDENGYPRPRDLYVEEGKAVGVMLKVTLAKRGIPDPCVGGDDGDPTAGEQ